MALKKVVWISVAFGCLAVAQQPPPEAPAASAEALRLNNEAARLSNAGHYQEAERKYRDALAVKMDDGLLRAQVFANLAVLYQSLERFADAEAMYYRALELRRKNLPPDSPVIAHSQNELAQIYWTEGRYWEARNLLETAVEKLENSAPDDPVLPLMINNLAVIRSGFHEYGEAEKLLRRALSSCEQLHGPRSLEFATALNNLAEVLEEKKDYQQAGPLYGKAIGIFESLGPKAAPDLAGALSNLGRLYDAQDRDQEAEQTEKRALALVDADPSMNFALRATILHHLANISVRSGNVEASLSYFEQCLSLRQKTLAADHPAIISVLLDYATATLRAGRKALSKQLQKQARQLGELRQRHDLSRLTIPIESLK